jgi:hypothetical protein
MDQEVLVNGLREVVARIEKNEGPVLLLMLAEADVGISDMWEVIVSSPGFDALPLREAVERFSDYLRECIDKSLWPYISRTVILRTDDPFVEGILRRLPQFGAGSTVRPLIVSGVEISTAMIIEAKKLAA